MPDEPERDVLRRFVRGDREAFEALFTLFQGDVYRWALWIVRDPSGAEDVVVDAFWRAYRGRARFDASRSFGAWMRRIATNAARDHLRSARHRPPSRSALQRTAEDIPAPAGADRDLAEAVALAFRTLPPKLQVVATLALIEERPYGEIADALDLPVGTIKSRVFRATRLLREELARLGIRP